MDFLRLFWDAACALNPDACKLDEGSRFLLCNPTNLSAAFDKAGFNNIQTASLDIETVFQNFDDYWQPFLGGQGPAPGYVSGLGTSEQESLKKAIYEKMPFQSDGTIRLLARAIAVRGSL